ncbi:beta-defensin 130B [Rhynchocyon petersi]
MSHVGQCNDDKESDELEWQAIVKNINSEISRTGVIPGQKQCILLKGVCRDVGCSSLDDTIGVCNHEKKCCRKWWVFEPYATPVPKIKAA